MNAAASSLSKFQSEQDRNGRLSLVNKDNMWGMDKQTNKPKTFKQKTHRLWWVNISNGMLEYERTKKTDECVQKLKVSNYLKYF